MPGSEVLILHLHCCKDRAEAEQAWVAAQAWHQGTGEWPYQWGLHRERYLTKGLLVGLHMQDSHPISSPAYELLLAAAKTCRAGRLGLPFTGMEPLVPAISPQSSSSLVAARSTSPKKAVTRKASPKKAPPKTAPPKKAPPKTAPPKTAPPKTAPTQTAPFKAAPRSPPRTAGKEQGKPAFMAPAPKRHASQVKLAGPLQLAEGRPATNLLGQCEDWRGQSPQLPFDQFFLTLDEGQQKTWVGVLGLRDLPGHSLQTQVSSSSSMGPPAKRAKQ